VIVGKNIRNGEKKKKVAKLLTWRRKPNPSKAIGKKKKNNYMSINIFL
jgi:hypothetical protein